MEQRTEPQCGRAQQEAPAHCSFPRNAIHGAIDQRCRHGKPEDGKRNMVRRDIGGKVK